MNYGLSFLFKVIRITIVLHQFNATLFCKYLPTTYTQNCNQLQLMPWSLFCASAILHYTIITIYVKLVSLYTYMYKCIKNILTHAYYCDIPKHVALQSPVESPVSRVSRVHQSLSEDSRVVSNFCFLNL